MSGGRKEPGELAGAGLELTMTVYNINFGCNQKIMDKCRILREYAQYVYQVREYAREMAFPKAVEAAVNYCISNRILSDFLTKNRAEAIAVSIFEYDEEKHIRNEKELSYQEGHTSGMEAGIKFGITQGMKQGMEQGMEQGKAENITKNVEALMNNLGLSLQKVCEGLGITVEEYERAKRKAAYQENGRT